MTLDFLDRAFLARWDAAEPAPTAAAVSIAAPEPPVVPPRPVVTHREITPAAQMPPDAGDRIDRLLETAGQQFAAVADEVEAARRRGRRVIAVTSSEPGAGCSTLVEGLVRLLRGRGRDAMRLAAPDEATDGPSHDKRIVLVDVGIWFPPGRINRQRLLVASTGCDAAIFVRKAGRPAPAAWGVALEAIGVEPLGEVVAFAPGDEAAMATGGCS